MNEENEKPKKEKTSMTDLVTPFKVNGVTVRDGIGAEIRETRDAVQNVLNCARNSAESVIADLEKQVTLTKEQKKSIRTKYVDVQGIDPDMVKKYQTVHSILSSATVIFEELER